jgi:hypothetical protein
MQAIGKVAFATYYCRKETLTEIGVGKMIGVKFEVDVTRPLMCVVLNRRCGHLLRLMCRTVRLA